MGWTSLSRTGEILVEGTHGRPVAAGEEGSLRAIFQEDYGHKVAIDLIGGVIIIDYESWELQNDTLGFANPQTVLYICDDTLIGADLFNVRRYRPNKEGWYKNKVTPIVWRPIWFSRVINGEYTKVIGAQTTTPKVHGKHNVKKMVMLFPDGRIGIY